MASEHVVEEQEVEEVEEPLEDITGDCFINEVVSEESEANDDETTTDGTHECDGGGSSASSSTSSVVIEFFAFGKGKEHCLEPFWISCPIRKVYTER